MKNLNFSPIDRFVRHARFDIAAHGTFFPSSNFKFVSGDLALTGF